MCGGLIVPEIIKLQPSSTWPLLFVVPDDTYVRLANEERLRLLKSVMQRHDGYKSVIQINVEDDLGMILLSLFYFSFCNKVRESEEFLEISRKVLCYSGKRTKVRAASKKESNK